MMGAVRAKHWTKRLIEAACICRWLASVDFCRRHIMSIPPCAFSARALCMFDYYSLRSCFSTVRLLASTSLAINKHRVFCLTSIPSKPVAKCPRLSRALIDIVGKPQNPNSGEMIDDACTSVELGGRHVGAQNAFTPTDFSIIS